MTVRPNSIELAAAALSRHNQVVILIETANGGGIDRYRVLDSLCEEAYAELCFRDIAIQVFPTIAEARALLERIERAFDEEPSTCFAARFSTFDQGHLYDILQFGADIIREREAA